MILAPFHLITHNAWVLLCQERLALLSEIMRASMEFWKTVRATVSVSAFRAAHIAEYELLGATDTTI